ncbi:unnamed protein product [Symbiodinium natans]|uniref:Uncharacterized protein n=1 Tax=Symbiodinium natans TaxID=878477 RepID=A0A812KX74_9DINO|nr:unnamed protein product [Symbiodinium natans]
MSVDVVEVVSPSAVVRVSSPTTRLPIERRRLQFSPTRVRDVEVTGRQRLGRAHMEISSLTEDIDHMRSELKFLQHDLKASEVAEASRLGVTNVSISTADTTRMLDSTFSGISDKVDAMKLDLDTERRHRLARDEDARSRLQQIQQTSDAHAAHQFHTDGRVRKIEDAVVALENRLDILFQDFDQSMKKRKEGEDALCRSLQEVRESLTKEAAERSARDEALSQQAAGFQELLQQERASRSEAQEEARSERSKALLRVAALEAQLAQVGDAVEAKFLSLRELVSGEKAARNGDIAKLGQDLADLNVTIRSEKDAAERRLTAFKDTRDKDIEEKLRAHRHALETSLDRRIAEVKESIDQGLTLAKQARDSLQFAMDRERESRKAWG